MKKLCAVLFLLPFLAFGQVDKARTTTQSIVGSAFSYQTSMQFDTLSAGSVEGKWVKIKNRWFFVWIGQSNAGCRCGTVGTNDTINGVFAYNRDATVPTFETFIAGVNNCPSGYYPSGDFGATWPFAKKLQGTDFDPAYIIKYAPGGTSIADWLNTRLDTLFSDFSGPAGTNTTDSAMMYTYGCVIDIRGEAEGQDLTEATATFSSYESLYEQIWAKYGPVPVIMTKLPHWESRASVPYWATVRAGQERFAAKYNNVHIINQDSLSFKTDSIHLDSAGGWGLADSIYAVLVRTFTKNQSLIAYTNSKDTVLNYGKGEYDQFDLDGTNEYFSIPYSKHLSNGNGTADSAFSYSWWANMGDATTFRVISSGFLGVLATDSMGWGIWTGSVDKLYVRFWDKDRNNYIGRASSSAQTSQEGILTHYVMTYSGNGSNTGITLYRDGQSITTTNVSSGSYTAMHDYQNAISLGAVYSIPAAPVTNYADGKYGPGQYIKKELSAAEVIALYDLGCPIGTKEEAEQLSSWTDTKGLWGNTSSFSTNWTWNNLQTLIPGINATGQNLEEADRSTNECN